jgi:RHS repeat-associated protein
VITNSGSSNGTVHTIHDGRGNIVAEADGSGDTVREYIWLPDAGYAGTDLSVAVVTDVDTTPVLYYAHTDHLGRPVKLTNASKSSVWDAVWLPFGGAHSITGTLTHDHRLPGQWYQLEAGLHYNWHRHYDPGIGRYTQPDPLGFVDGPSQYAYAESNILFLIDPSGLANFGGNGPKMPPAANDNGPRNMPGTQTDFRPNPTQNTKPGVQQPQSTVKGPGGGKADFCYQSYLRCTAGCLKSKLCKHPVSQRACQATCFTWLGLCTGISLGLLD